MNNQLLYLPYNVFRWCIFKELIPNDSMLVFVETNVVKGELKDFQELRILLDITKSEQDQMLQLLTIVASYNYLKKHEKVDEKAIVNLIKEYLALWEVDLSLPVEERQEVFELDKSIHVVHPVLVFLQFVDLSSYEIVVIGKLENYVNSGLLYIEFTTWQEQYEYVVNQFKNITDLSMKMKDRWGVLQGIHDDLKLPRI